MIDFTELPEKPPGEALEKLTRELGKRLGLQPVWSGRGPDGGRDLLFSEIQSGPVSSRPVKWLVSCKDHARSGTAVTESDVGSIVDKVRQHKVDGFLLVTTTIPGVALKDKLDAIDHRSGGEIYTKVWDSHELTSLLLQEDFLDLLKTYFPESYERNQSFSKPQLALKAIEDALPKEVAVEVHSLVSPHLDRRSALLGLEVWPYDREGARIVDELVKCLIDDGDVKGAVDILFDKGLDFDAYMALLNCLHKNYPNIGYDFLSHVVLSSDDEGVSLNAFQFLSEHYEFAPGDQMRLASHLDPESLEILYWNEIQYFIENELMSNASTYELWSDIDALSSRSQIGEVFIDTLAFEGNPDKERPSVYFTGSVLIDVELSFDHESTGNESFPGRGEGYVVSSGMFIDKATVNTSEYYGKNL